MINLQALRIGDIIGTTALTPQGTLIKARLWGWKSMFRQDLPNHIAVLVSRGHGLYYFAEMLYKGLALTECSYYDHKPPRQHICFVGRHSAFDVMETQVRFNNFILEAHARKVKYGWEDLLKFLNVNLKDNPNTWICSELPREAFNRTGISYPKGWDKNCSPKNWWEWTDLKNITKEVVA